MLGISSDDLRGFLNAIRTYEWWHLMLTQSSEKDPTHLQSPALHKQRNEIRKNGDRWEGLLKSLQRTSALGFFLYFLVAHAQLALIFQFLIRSCHYSSHLTQCKLILFSSAHFHSWWPLQKVLFSSSSSVVHSGKMGVNYLAIWQKK